MNVVFADEPDKLYSSSIGFVVWNFIDDFGLQDAGRTNVVYENWHGHQLYRNLMRKYYHNCILISK